MGITLGTSRHGEDAVFNFNECIKDIFNVQMSCDSGCCSCNINDTVEEEVLSPNLTPNIVHTDPWDISHMEEEQLDNDIQKLRELLLKKEKMKIEADRSSVKSEASEVVTRRRVRRNSYPNVHKE